MVIKTVKELREKNVKGISVYRFSSPLTVHNGTSIDEFGNDGEVFIFNGKYIISTVDQALIAPAILFKAKISLLTPSEWDKDEN